MKKIIISLLTFCSLYCGMATVAFAQGQGAADLQQLRRLQRLADEQLRKAQEVKAKQEPQQKQSQQVTLPAALRGDKQAGAQGPQLPNRAGAQGGNAQVKRMMPKVSSRERVRNLAFRQLIDQMFPLTTEQIVELRKKYNSTELAKTVTSMVPPKPVATSQFVNLSPGSNPPIVRLSKGFVTSIVFLDSSGAPWPIAALDLGDPRTFNIQWDRSSNVIMIQALKQYQYGNLAVRLRDLNTPVMITLLPGQKAVDYRIDMRVQGYGPNAHVPTGDLLPPQVHKELLGLLDGVPPMDSRELEVVGAAAQAWVRGSNLFLRTRHQVISPGWFATLRSADGMHVYRLAKTPLVLVTHHGRIKRLKIEGL